MYNNILANRKIFKPIDVAAPAATATATKPSHPSHARPSPCQAWPSHAAQAKQGSDFTFLWLWLQLAAAVAMDFCGWLLWLCQSLWQWLWLLSQWLAVAMGVAAMACGYGWLCCGYGWPCLWLWQLWLCQSSLFSWPPASSKPQPSISSCL